MLPDQQGDKPMAPPFGSGSTDLEMALLSNMKIVFILSPNVVFYILHKQKKIWSKILIKHCSCSIAFKGMSNMTDCKALLFS